MPESSVAVISGKSLADYHFGENHAFGPKRHKAFIDGMRARGLTDQVDWHDPVMCDVEDLLYFHNRDFVDQIIQKSSTGIGFLDMGDTPARAGIFEAASTVVGSVLDMVNRVMDDQYRRGFVPIAGLHHGFRDHVSGFCVFNDCAIAIEHLRRDYQLRKILYVDIDAHHGDGVFYNYDSDSDLYIIDIHEDGRYLYPGTGDADETGSGPARGSKMNLPMKKNADDNEFAEQWKKAEAFVREIEPEFIILQCGADGMQGDTIAHLDYTERSYSLAAESLCHLADEFCNGRLIALGGGGYNMDNIALAWPAVVQAML